MPKKLRHAYVSLGYVFVFFIIWGLGSLRWQTGTDWTSYFDSFTYFSEDYAVNFEPGFVIFLSSIRSITDNYTIYLAIFTFLCVWLKMNFFFKYHKETFFTLVLLYYCYYFADIFAVRQNLAISITIVSTIFIIKRKPIWFTLFVFIATTFHISLILYFLAYIVYWSKISDKLYYIIIGVSIFLGLIGFGNIVLNKVLGALGIDGFVGQKISNYLSGDVEGLGSNINSTLTYILGVIKRLIFIPVFFYINKRTHNRVNHFRGYLNLYMIGNIIYFLFAKDLTVFARASVPFLFFEIFLLAYTLDYFKKYKQKFALVFLFIIVFSWARFNALVNSYYELYVPYNSIFDNKIEREL